jgi:hypothetical protein
VLIQNGVDVNALQEDNLTALPIAAVAGNTPYILQLLCFGAEIDEKTINAHPKSKIRERIHDVLITLRDGSGTKTTFMSNEERRFMWNLGFVLAVKHPAIACGTYHMIRSFVTYHGIFMGPGYDLGEGSIWRADRLPMDRSIQSLLKPRK